MIQIFKFQLIVAYFMLLMISDGNHVLALSLRPRAAENHTISVIMALDNDYILNIDGKLFNETGTHWQNIKTFTTTVRGKGPWIVAVQGRDYGVVSGFIGTVFLDGVPIAVTGKNDKGLLPFKMSKEKPQGWDTLSFDDSTWSKSNIDPIGCNSEAWGDWISRFQSISGTKATPVWKDTCNDVNIMNYFRVKVRMAARNPKPLLRDMGTTEPVYEILFKSLRP